jgi:acyl-CoA dehydrogenase
VSIVLTDVQKELQAVAHEFAEREIRPVAAHHDATEEFPAAVFAQAAEIGLTCYDIPAEYGGGGIEDLSTACLIAEELAWGDPAIGALIGSASFFAGTILELGTPEQRQRWVPPLCGPDPVLGALATTEPEAGSDASAIATHARPEDGGYVLNGQKTWISNAGVAELYLVFATVAPGTRARGITAFVVERGDPGFEVGPKMGKLGQRCIPTAELFLRDVRLPADRRVGAEGQGFHGLMEKFDRSRVALAAGEVGLGRAALEYAVEYARERRTWGRPIHENQAVSFRLVDARMKVDQARLLTHHAAGLADAGRPFATEAAMAKLAASEAAWYSAWACCQTLGGYGYSREYPAERWLRDAKLEEIWEGTSDIMRLIISRDLFPRG